MKIQITLGSSASSFALGSYCKNTQIYSCISRDYQLTRLNELDTDKTSLSADRRGVQSSIPCRGL